VLRPEKVALGTAARACINRFPARVVEATFLGDQLRVRLATLGQEDFVLKLPNAAGQGALEPGATVEIGWRTEDCRALVA
jgi:putative spermidine/putrescine transport system ATP-binding protein